MRKTALRTHYLNKRNELSIVEVDQRSELVTEWMISILTPEISSIHTFVPIAESKEINTWDIIYYCWKNNISTATSITHFNPKRLEHSWFDEDTVFTSGIYNVPIPVPFIPANIIEFDLVIVPLLCIDAHGNRIGYGQGFYDSFLSLLPEKTKKMGVSLFEIHPEIIEPDAWDVKLDCAILPEGIIEF